ncbi:MAG: bifunctional DNA-formamidopyrimidine glycosylase/DNA-(apurinic or apyrimidinic site) lyase [Patescibacteria group bacterium]
MPELPEVQTTVNDLQKKLVGLKFKDVWTDWPKTFKKAGGFDYFKKTIKDKKIINIRRRAKFIVIDVECKFSIFIHQKISGHLLYGKWNMEEGVWKAAKPGPLRDERENQYIRTIWTLSNGYQLAFSDLRRFGKIVLVKDDELSNLPEIKNLGPEPLEISVKDFKKLFDGKRGRIKQVLMDPFFIVGIGNIYSDEILWDSGYHPLARVENLKNNDLKKIFDSIQKILKKAIKAGGTSIEDYRKISGEMGRYQNYTEAYHQHGKKCSKKDRGTIERIRVGGRSAHFCPVHQKLK